MPGRAKACLLWAGGTGGSRAPAVSDTLSDFPGRTFQDHLKVNFRQTTETTMRTLAYLLPCLVLTACITPKMVDSHLETAKGQPLDSLIKKWGYPDGEQMVAGKRVVTWKDTMDGGCQRAVELDSGNRAIHVSARGDLERCYRLTE